MFTDLAHRLRSLLRRRRVEQDLHDELHFHFERLVDRHLAHGLPRDEARRRARLEIRGLAEAPPDGAGGIYVFR